MSKKLFRIKVKISSHSTATYNKIYKISERFSGRFLGGVDENDELVVLVPIENIIIIDRYEEREENI